MHSGRPSDVTVLIVLHKSADIHLWPQQRELWQERSEGVEVDQSGYVYIVQLRYSICNAMRWFRCGYILGSISVHILKITARNIGNIQNIFLSAKYEAVSFSSV